MAEQQAVNTQQPTEPLTLIDQIDEAGFSVVYELGLCDRIPNFCYWLEGTSQPAAFAAYGVLLVLGLIGLWLVWALIRAWYRSALKKVEAQERIDEYNNTIAGAARFGTYDDLAKAHAAGKDADGLIVGREGWHKELVYYGDDAHLITFAPTGSGKGTSAIVPNLLSYMGSVVCIDPKGENAQITARRRRELGQDVFILDPWNLASEESAQFNPLTLLDPKSPDFSDDTKLIAEALVVADKDDHWTREAKALINAFITYIACHEPPEKRTLGRLNEILSMPPEKMDFLLKNMSEKSPYPVVQRAGSRILQKQEKERSSVISSAQSQLHFLESERMNSVLSTGHNHCDLQNIKQRNMTVYLVLPAERLASHSRWLRLMISMIMRTMSYDRTPVDIPVLFLLDEFAALGYLEEMEKSVPLMRGYGVKLWPILQDLSQLHHYYPKTWQSFIANAGAIQVFGTNDQGTADYFSKRCGTETRVSKTQGSPTQHSDGVTYGRTGRPLMLPEEIMQIDQYNQLLFLKSLHPFKIGKSFFYDSHKYGSEFVGQYDASSYSPQYQPKGIAVPKGKKKKSRLWKRKKSA